MDVLNVQLYFDRLDVRCFKQRLGSLEGASNASLVQINVFGESAPRHFIQQYFPNYVSNTYINLLKAKKKINRSWLQSVTVALAAY